MYDGQGIDEADLQELRQYLDQITGSPASHIIIIKRNSLSGKRFMFSIATTPSTNSPFSDYSATGDHMLTGIRMPEKYVVEMFCDRMVFSIATTPSTNSPFSLVSFVSTNKFYSTKTR